MIPEMDQEEERRSCLEMILNSASPRKLIVAGPGTGKSHTFKALLERTGGPSLALTFINALAVDLGDKLGTLAETYTFHGYCRSMLHKHQIGGITMGVDYYPPLLLIQADDLSRLSGEPINSRDIERDFHFLDLSTGLVDQSVHSGDYYNAAGHLDSVYRVLRYFHDAPASVPVYQQLVVDEYQDFSLLEVNFIKALAQQSNTLIVGDDDQALYGFKHASADYIRELAVDSNYDHFALPYCSRCTKVLVDATHTVISRARLVGLLKGRLNKRYECYLPSKQIDSDAYPKIIHAACSVERNSAPYIGRYVYEQIQAISAEDVTQSYTDSCPTVLVIGPPQFAKRVYSYLAERMVNVQMRHSTSSEVTPVEGYIRIAADRDSRLGWRIILYVDPVANMDDVLYQALIEGFELADILPEGYKKTHLTVAALLQRFRRGDSLDTNELGLLLEAVSLSVNQLRIVLRLEEEVVPRNDETVPSIVVTTLVGAKGLQASHVFVVGLNEGHFPISNQAITDNEVCSFLVALTRATKSCTLVSCGRFGNQQVRPSAFLTWLKSHTTDIRVNKAYFTSRPAVRHSKAVPGSAK